MTDTATETTPDGSVDPDLAANGDMTQAAARRHEFIDPLTRREPGAALIGAAGERLAQSLSASLDRRFRAPTPVTSAPAIRQPHETLLNSMSATALLGAFSLPPFAGEVWWIVDRALVFALADRWFGGSGLMHDEPKPLSKSERQVLDALIESIARAIEFAWQPHEAIRVSTSDNGDRDRLQRLRCEQAWINCAFDIEVGDGTARALILYPGAMLSPLDQRMSDIGKQRHQPDQGFSDRMRTGLLGCDLELKGVMAETRITLGELMRLSAGDFIPLDEQQTVSFRANDRVVFDASMGTSNGRVSASVSRVHLPIRS